MKKIISIALAAAMSLSMMSAAVHAEDNPKVYIDGTQVYFADQQPVILGEGTTLVPARGVFEAMGLNVGWNGDARLVSVDTPNNVTRIRLTIDDPVMKIFTFTSIFHSDESDVELAIAPQIINDRTMIPLRAISEAVGADVKWDGDAYSVIITTADYEPYTPPEDPEVPAGDGVKPGMSISSSVDSVSEGDTVDIYVNLSNMPADSLLSGVTALISYSPEDFKYTGCSLYKGGQDVEDGEDNATTPDGMSAENAFYHENAVKAAMITLDKSMPTSGSVAKFSFKALTSKGGEFALVNSYDTSRGYDNSFTFMKNGSNVAYDLLGDNLYVNTTPVTVSGK